MRIHLDFALICSLLSFVFVKVGTYENAFRFCFDLFSFVFCLCQGRCLCLGVRSIDQFDAQKSDLQIET